MLTINCSGPGDGQPDPDRDGEVEQTKDIQAIAALRASSVLAVNAMATGTASGQ